jgi:hypothetical protein
MIQTQPLWWLTVGLAGLALSVNLYSFYMVVKFLKWMYPRYALKENDCEPLVAVLLAQNLLLICSIIVLGYSVMQLGES